jgi:hypothetical protein
MNAESSVENIFRLLGAKEIPECSVDCFDIVNRSSFALHTGRARELAEEIVSIMAKHPFEPAACGGQNGHCALGEQAGETEAGAGEAFFREVLPVDTVVYDQGDPVLGIMVADALNGKMGHPAGKGVAAVPNMFCREYRLSSIDPRYGDFITRRRVLIVARHTSSNPCILNCARACHDLRALDVYLAAIANFGRSPEQLGTKGIRSVLLY